MRTSDGIKRILVVTAVDAEKEAVQRGLKNDGRFLVLAGGVGQAAAAACTATALATGTYDLVVSAGIGGGFPGGAEIESLVVANEMIAADLGVETAQGFVGMNDLGFGTVRLPADAHATEALIKALQCAGLPIRLGPVLTVSTATGTADTALQLARRFEGAVAEAMEGYGVALAAHLHSVPAVEIRAVSNAVGPRDRASWRVQEALGLLEAAGAVFKEVFG